MSKFLVNLILELHFSMNYTTNLTSGMFSTLLKQQMVDVNAPH